MAEYRETCRACTSFKSFLKAQSAMTAGKKKEERKEPEQPKVNCPLDKDELGRASWSFLHTMAAYYPDNPTNEEKKDMYKFVSLFSKFYPCSHCAKDMRKDIVDDPPEVNSRASFSLWMCNLHNKVNRKLGKPIFDCLKVDERWLNGPSDGSCD